MDLSRTRTNGKYLITATEREIEQLYGPNKDFDRQTSWYKSNNSGSLVGLKIDVDTAYLQLAWLQRRDSEFYKLCKALRDTAEHIESSKPLFDRVIGDKWTRRL